MDIGSIIYSAPEKMIKKYGDYNTTVTFKLIHNGEKFTFPHYNFDIHTYIMIYIDYLKIIMNIDTDIELFHVNDKQLTNNLIDLNKDSTNSDEKIEDFIHKHFNSDSIAFYIRIENTNQYDVEQSLITNSTFKGECTICYENNELKHYYKCDIRDTNNNHHGICGSCYIEWYRANSQNNCCPTCRSIKK